MIMGMPQRFRLGMGTMSKKKLCPTIVINRLYNRPLSLDKLLTIIYGFLSLHSHKQYILMAGKRGTKLRVECSVRLDNRLQDLHN